MEDRKLREGMEIHLRTYVYIFRVTVETTVIGLIFPISHETSIPYIYIDDIVLGPEPCLLYRIKFITSFDMMCYRGLLNSC